MMRAHSGVNMTNQDRIDEKYRLRSSYHLIYLVNCQRITLK